MNRILITLIFIFLVGCASSSQVQTPQMDEKLPSWYLSPPKSDGHFAYATGSGLTKRDAILDALSNFVAQFSTTISSKFESRSSYYGGGLADKKAVRDIKASIKKFEITNYTIERSEQYDFDKILVLLKIDLNALYKNIVNKIQNKFSEYKSRYNGIIRENALLQLIELRKLLKEMNNEKSYLSILKVMNANFDEKRYLSFIDEVQNRIKFLENNLTISVISNNPAILGDVEKYLTDKGIKIGKSDIIVDANVRKKVSYFSGIRLTTYQVFLRTFYRNKLLGSNFFKIVTNGNSNLSGILYNEIKNLPLERGLNLSQ